MKKSAKILCAFLTATMLLPSQDCSGGRLWCAKECAEHSSKCTGNRR